MCPENPLQHGCSFLTEWFVLVPQKYDVFNNKWQSFLKPTVYYKMASPYPIFFHRMEAYTRVNPIPSILWRKWQGGCFLNAFDPSTVKQQLF